MGVGVEAARSGRGMDNVDGLVAGLVGGDITFLQKPSKENDFQKLALVVSEGPDPADVCLGEYSRAHQPSRLPGVQRGGARPRLLQEEGMAPVAGRLYGFGPLQSAMIGLAPDEGLRVGIFHGPGRPVKV